MIENNTVINDIYQVIRPIGSGGLGEIYLGYHLRLHKQVVIKRVKENCRDLINNRIEVDILKGLHHRYLPQVYDFVQMGTDIFTVMDYISGRDLDYYIKQGVRFEEAQIVLWLKQLLDVLDYLHTRSMPILHCDIKPPNIMITDTGDVCLIDFNISLDGENNKELIGLSSQFASPEQARRAMQVLRYGTGEGVPLDGRSDLYSLALTMYTLMTGIYPGPDKEALVPLTEIDHGYSDALSNLLNKALNTDSSKRFKSAADMRKACDRIYRWSDAWRFYSRLGWLLDTGFAALFVLFLCGILIGFRGREREDFYEAYDAYIRQVNEAWEEGAAEESLQEVVTSGVALLNTDRYQDDFSSLKAKKGEVLLAVGEAGISVGQYETAVSCLEDATECLPASARAYRDLTVACAQQGDLDGAEEAAAKAEALGLDDEDGALLSAQLALLSGDYQTAYDKAVLAAESTDEQTVRQAVQTCVAAAEELGCEAECVDFLLEQADKLERYLGVYWLREAGALATEADLPDRAAACYEKIDELSLASLDDQYSLAAAYEASDQLEKGREYLLRMTEYYPEEYKACLQLSYVCYRLQNSKPLPSRSYTEVRKYYEKAVQIMEDQDLDPSENEDMAQMQEIIEELVEQGWLAEE